MNLARPERRPGSPAARPTEPEVHFVSLRGIDGRPIALLANYSLHYVGGLPAGGVSADYFGVFAGLIEKAIGKDDDFIFTNRRVEEEIWVSV